MTSCPVLVYAMQLGHTLQGCVDSSIAGVVSLTRRRVVAKLIRTRFVVSFVRQAFGLIVRQHR